MSTSRTALTQSSEGDNKLSQRLLGGVFLVFSAVLLATLVYFLFEVVIPLTTPSPFFEQLSKTHYEELRTKGAEQQDQLTLDFVLLLEYASADIRTAGIQVAFSLFGGLVLIVIGVLLLTAGVTGTLQLSGKHLDTGFDIKAATPGIACIVLGAGILAMGIHKDVSRSVGATIERGIDVNYGSRTERPPIAEQGESRIDSNGGL